MTCLRDAQTVALECDPPTLLIMSMTNGILPLRCGSICILLPCRRLRSRWYPWVTCAPLASTLPMAGGLSPLRGFVARSARYDRGSGEPQAACHSGHLPAVKHGSALRAVSLRDDVSPCGRVTAVMRL